MTKQVGYKILLFVVVVLSVLPTAAKSQTNYASTIYNAYIRGDANKWLLTIQTIEKNDELKNIDQKLEFINYYYGYVSLLIRLKEQDKVNDHLPKLNRIIVDFIHQYPKSAFGYGYKAAWCGFQISTNKFKMLSLGSESNTNLQKALSIDSRNVIALIVKANSLLHTPGIFGGDKPEALKIFNKCTKMMEANKNTSQNWLYLNTLVFEAKANEKNEKIQEAKKIYEKIIQIEPGFSWVRNNLYPKLINSVRE